MSTQTIDIITKYRLTSIYIMNYEMVTMSMSTIYNLIKMPNFYEISTAELKPTLKEFLVDKQYLTDCFSRNDFSKKKDPKPAPIKMQEEKCLLSKSIMPTVEEILNAIPDRYFDIETGLQVHACISFNFGLVGDYFVNTLTIYQQDNEQNDDNKINKKKRKTISESDIKTELENNKRQKIYSEKVKTIYDKLVPIKVRGNFKVYNVPKPSFENSNNDSYIHTDIDGIDSMQLTQIGSFPENSCNIVTNDNKTYEILYIIPTFHSFGTYRSFKPSLYEVAYQIANLDIDENIKELYVTTHYVDNLIETHFGNHQIGKTIIWSLKQEEQSDIKSDITY
jgi:hypothetical protein